MEIHKKHGSLVACFPKEELLRMYEDYKKSLILEELTKRGKTLDNFNSISEAQEWMSELVQTAADDRDEHELIATLFFVADFYEDTCEVCFKLKNSFNHNKDKIDSINTLNEYRDDPPDFIIKQSDGWRDFELKRYRNTLDTNTVFDFITEKVKHYRDLGDMNLLLILQSKDSNDLQIDFHDLHERLIKQDYNFKGQILLSFNNNNTEMVINQVFPELTTSTIPFALPSQKK